MIKISFLGAAKTVTGSKYLVENHPDAFLVDCGSFQGLKSLRKLNWEKPAFDPRRLRCVVLTHAHIDHLGYLPRLVRLGFRGDVYATPSTRRIAEIMLRDAAKLQMEEAEYRNRKRITSHRPALPLFDLDDVERSLHRFRPVPLERWTTVTPTLRFQFRATGHILGAAMVELEIEAKGGARTVVFSGDVGRYDAPLMSDPDPPPPCDVLVTESTYGNRFHGDEDPHEALAAVVRRVFERKGVLLVPAFALGRTQQLILLFGELMQRGSIPPAPIHIDSPMAAEVTEIYREYAEGHRGTNSQFDTAVDLLFGRHIRLHRSQEESKALNHMEGPAILVSASGMLTGGRVVHHLRWVLPDPRHLVLLVGYQAEGTRGRYLEEGAPTLRILRREIPVQAEVAKMTSLSAHADQRELLRWLSGADLAPSKVFVTHGEEEAARDFARTLHQARGWTTYVPSLGETAPIEGT